MSSDWKNDYYPAGSFVRVMDIHNKLLGTGKLLTDFYRDSEDNEMPKIQMEDGEILYGYDCWWIPVDEIEDIEKKFNVLL